VSRLRARCPDCGGFSAVAVGPGYECHSCGREFAAGLVRVPRAFGQGGEAMAEAAWLPLPYPEVAVVEEESLREQALALAACLPERPLVLGGCCCAHLGAVEGLASRYERLALLWLDAHGDLNTPQTSPSGNEWGMPLRMILDRRAVRLEDAALIGARSLDPGEREFLAASGLAQGREGMERALRESEAVYVAFDADVLAPGQLPCYLPEPGGLTLAEAEELLAAAAACVPVAGVGFSGLTADPLALPALERLCAALGL
jgi:arginase family enzyme